MGLPKAHAAVNKERVVGLGRRLPHGKSGRMRKLVVGTYHERIKGVPRVHPVLHRGGAFVGDMFRVAVPVHRLFGAQGECLGLLRLLGRPPGLAVKNELHFMGGAQHFGDGGLQERHVIRLNPKLENVVRHAQGELVFLCLREFHRHEPSLKCIDADFRADFIGNMIPKDDKILVHK